ncbi:CbtB-domain containing protein [Hansschlegelia quercus]|uniref:CbtB-domain containing protein n=1 Tax=Hansschlegelia quercus TaxID=2528245 RepID=A0A4V2JE28_9HYPH|nr:CbtB-domain containing protein [Hansschlegelia quercus]TBN53556.1 CbtB-domain containing protein [Hansschlegelia quercus]
MTNAAFATSASTPSRAEPIPVSKILPWAVFGGLMLVLTVYFVGAEEGATSLIGGSVVHEFVHDGRHLLGFPCH